MISYNMLANFPLNAPTCLHGIKFIGASPRGLWTKTFRSFGFHFNDDSVQCDCFTSYWNISFQFFANVKISSKNSMKKNETSGICRETRQYEYCINVRAYMHRNTSNRTEHEREKKEEKKTREHFISQNMLK